MLAFATNHFFLDMSDFFQSMHEKREQISAVDLLEKLPSNYVGGKRRLLKHMASFLETNGAQYNSVFDAFSGSGFVSAFFRMMGKHVRSNDILSAAAISTLVVNSFHFPLAMADIPTIHPTDGGFMMRTYGDKVLTRNECAFLDSYRLAIKSLPSDKYFCAIEAINKALLYSIPNSNFTVRGKDIKKLRSAHTPNTPFWKEKWRDTTRKRRNDQNEIMFDMVLREMIGKYSIHMDDASAQVPLCAYTYFNNSLCSLRNHIEDLDCKILPPSDKANLSYPCVINADIIALLEQYAEVLASDLLYLDPPYGGAASDYAKLYGVMEENIYGKPLEELPQADGLHRFVSRKEYQQQFEKLLSLCGRFKFWLLSYNDSSFDTLENIVSIVKGCGKTNVVTCDIPIAYKFRGTRMSSGAIDVDCGRASPTHGIEHLILAA